MESREKQLLRKINECLLGFTADPDSNIELVTSCCGELMNGACSLYSRMDGGMLHTVAQWKAPPGFNPLDRPDGHICHDVIKAGGRKVMVINDLQQTCYARTDPNVSAYGLQTYVGAPVNCEQQCVGSLCVVYQNDYTPDEEEKKVLQILAAAVGVEEERRIEAEALRKAKEDLESRVEERTTELARVNEELRIDVAERKRAEVKILRINRMLKEKTEQLLDAQVELVRKEKLAVLGRLAGCVGHELRNPLGVIGNAVYFLKTVLADSDQTVKEYLDIIGQEVGNSLKIISDLLDFSRRSPPVKLETEAGRLVGDSIGRCAIPEKVSVSLDIPGDLPMVYVDRQQIEQVFFNLITNAVEAMPEGGSLRISAREVSGCGLKVSSSIREPESRQQDGTDSNFQLGTFALKQGADSVEIRVEDTGEGISRENMKNLFQPLFTTKARGIGLGLVVSRNLVEANGGRIDVESVPGGGSTFVVSLPVIDSISEGH